MEYKNTSEELPPDGTLCWTVSENGMEQALKYASRLWWQPDGSSYVYYTPKKWRKLFDFTISG